MVGLALVLLTYEETGSFRAAGLAVAGYSVGSGALAPLRGRLVDRLGASRILPIVGVAYCGSLTATLLGGSFQAPTAWFVAWSTLAGATAPPVIAVSRAMWSGLAEEQQRRAAYAMLVTTGDIAAVVGPLLVGALATAVSPALALAVCALTGGLAVAMVAGLGGTTPQPRREDQWHILGALASRSMQVLFAVGVGLGICLGVLDIALPAFADREGDTNSAALLLGAFAGGSLIGGLWYGRHRHDRPANDRYVRLMGALALGFFPLWIADSVVAMAILLMAAGGMYAPASIVLFELLDDAVPGRSAVEAFTWVTSAEAAGLAMGAALGGIVVSEWSVRTALWGSFAAIAISALLAAIGGGALGRNRGTPLGAGA